MRKLRSLLVLVFVATTAFAQQPKRFTISANGGCALVSAQNNSTVGIIVSGTWVGTLTPTLQIAGVSNAPTAATSVTPTNSTTSQTTITTNGGFRGAVNGFSQFNLCATAWTSGSAIVDLFATQADSSLSGGGGGGGGSVTQGTSPWVDNVSQFGGNNVATGAGASGVGVPRVTVANDSTATATPLVVRQSDGTNSITAALSAWGTAPGGTQVQGVNSDVFIGGVIAANSAAGVQKVGIVGGTAGASVDASVAPGTAPTNGFPVLARYANSAPGPTTGQTLGVQSDSAGDLFVRPFRRSQVVCQATTIASSSSATTIISAQAASTFADISNLMITVTPAATTDIGFTATLSDGTISYLYDMDTGALATATADPTQVNINFNPAMPATTAATAWTLQLSVATVTVHITACFEKGLAN
jgi:hypothetical protein